MRGSRLYSTPTLRLFPLADASHKPPDEWAINGARVVALSPFRPLSRRSEKRREYGKWRDAAMLIGVTGDSEGPNGLSIFLISGFLWPVRERSKWRETIEEATHANCVWHEGRKVGSVVDSLAALLSLLDSWFSDCCENSIVTELWLGDRWFEQDIIFALYSYTFSLRFS